MTQVLTTSSHLTNNFVTSEEASVCHHAHGTPPSPNRSRYTQGGSFPQRFPTKSQLLQHAKFYDAAAFKASNQDHHPSDTLSHQQIKIKSIAFNRQAPDLVTGISLERKSALLLKACN